MRRIFVNCNMTSGSWCFIKKWMNHCKSENQVETTVALLCGKYLRFDDRLKCSGASRLQNLVAAVNSIRTYSRDPKLGA